MLSAKILGCPLHVKLPLLMHTDCEGEAHTARPGHACLVIASLPDQPGRVGRAGYRTGEKTKIMELVPRDASSVYVYFWDTKKCARIPRTVPWVLDFHEENGRIVRVDMFTPNWPNNGSQFCAYFGISGADNAEMLSAKILGGCPLRAKLPLLMHTDCKGECHTGQAGQVLLIASLPDQPGRVGRAIYRAGKKTQLMELVPRDASSVEVYFWDTKKRARIPRKVPPVLEFHEENGLIVRVHLFTPNNGSPFCAYFGTSGAHKAGFEVQRKPSIPFAGEDTLSNLRMPEASRPRKVKQAMEVGLEAACTWRSGFA